MEAIHTDEFRKLIVGYDRSLMKSIAGSNIANWLYAPFYRVDDLEDIVRKKCMINNWDFTKTTVVYSNIDILSTTGNYIVACFIIPNHTVEEAVKFFNRVIQMKVFL
jgi:hypothetical protein